MINTPVSVPVYQIYPRGDDNEDLRSRRAFGMEMEKDFFFLPSRCIDPSFGVRKGCDIASRMENALPRVNYSNRESVIEITVNFKRRKVLRYLQFPTNYPFPRVEAAIARVNAAFVAFGRAMN